MIPQYRRVVHNIVQHQFADMSCGRGAATTHRLSHCQLEAATTASQGRPVLCDSRHDGAGNNSELCGRLDNLACKSSKS